MSVLRSTFNHIALKYRCPYYCCVGIRHVYLRGLHSSHFTVLSLEPSGILIFSYLATEMQHYFLWENMMWHGARVSDILFRNFMMSDWWNNLEGFDLVSLLARKCQQIVSFPGVSFWSTLWGTWKPSKYSHSNVCTSNSSQWWKQIL